MAYRGQAPAKRKHKDPDPDTLKDWEEAFSLFKSDKASFLTPVEAKMAFLNLGIEMTQTRINELCGNSGQLDWDEFRNQMVFQTNDVADVNDLQAALRSLGKDGGDVIKASELRIAMTSLGERLSYEEATELVIDADPDGTGQVDTWEFANLLARADE